MIDHFTALKRVMSMARLNSQRPPRLATGRPHRSLRVKASHLICVLTFSAVISLWIPFFSHFTTFPSVHPDSTFRFLRSRESISRRHANKTESLVDVLYLNNVLYSDPNARGFLHNFPVTIDDVAMAAASDEVQNLFLAWLLQRKKPSKCNDLRVIHGSPYSKSDAWPYCHDSIVRKHGDCIFLTVSSSPLPQDLDQSVRKALGCRVVMLWKSDDSFISDSKSVTDFKRAQVGLFSPGDSLVTANSEDVLATELCSALQSRNVSILHFDCDGCEINVLSRAFRQCGAAQSLEALAAVWLDAVWDLQSMHLGLSLIAWLQNAHLRMRRLDMDPWGAGIAGSADVMQSAQVWFGGSVLSKLVSSRQNLAEVGASAGSYLADEIDAWKPAANSQLLHCCWKVAFTH